MSALPARLAALAALALAPAAAARPPLPEVPPAPSKLAPAIARMTDQVARVLSECQDSGERNPGGWDRRCPGWLRAIDRGGEAADRAIWAGLFPADPRESLWTMHEGYFATQTTTRLLDGLVARANPLSVAALVATIPAAPVEHEAPPLDPRERFRVLSGLTGHDALPFEITASYDGAALACVGEAWRRWWADHHGRPLDELRAAGYARAREALSDAGEAPTRLVMSVETCAPSELDVRFHAATQLLRSRAEGDAELVRAALRTELGSPELTAEAIWRFDALAETAGLAYAERQAAMANRRAALVARGDEEAKAEQKRIDATRQREALVSRCRAELDGLKLEEALASCEAAVALDSGDTLARATLGWVQLELGQLAEAEASAAEAGGLEPSPWTPHELAALGVAVLTLRGEVERAREVIGYLDSVDPTSEVAARQALLEGRAAPAAWVREVAPRHTCWARKGEDAARAFLARRGFVQPEAFAKAASRLAPTERAQLERWADAHCPWVAADASPR
jgi:hypothetical protein